MPNLISWRKAFHPRMSFRVFLELFVTCIFQKLFMTVRCDAHYTAAALKLIKRRQSLAVQKLPRAIAKWWPRVQPFSRVGWFSDGSLVSVRDVWWNLRLFAQCLYFNFGRPFSFAEQIMTRVKVTEGPSGEGKAVEVPLLCSPSHVPRLCTFYPSRFGCVYDPLR